MEKKKPEKIENQEVLQIEQETEIAEEKSTRRRGQRVNYTALATGTPTRASTSEKLPDKRGRKKLMDEADEKQEPTIAERRVRRGKTPSTADDEVKEVKLQRSKEIHPKTPEVLTKEPEIQSKEPEVLPSTDAQDEAEKPIKIQAKRGRGKKEAIEVELEVPEVVKQPAKRGRRAETPAVETPITVTKTTSRRGKPEPASLTSTEDIELPKAPSKRGRKPTVKVPEAKPVEVAEVLEPAKSLVRKSTKRGRKEIQTTETESQDSTDEAAVVAKPSRRGKKPAEVEPKATEKTTVEVSEPKRDKKEEVESISIAVTKSRRGAAKRKVETSEEEVETVPVIPKDQRIAQLSEEAVATPSKRGRRGTTLEIAEAKPEQKPTRGRKKAVVEETVTVEAVAVEEAPKKGRGRVKKEVSEELTGDFFDLFF